MARGALAGESSEGPRNAATILMLLIARGGDPTPQQIAAIRQTVATVFGFEGELVERLTQALHRQQRRQLRRRGLLARWPAA